MIAFYHSFIEKKMIFYFPIALFLNIFIGGKFQSNILHNSIRIMLLVKTKPLSFYMYYRLIIMIAFYHSFIKVNRYFYFIILVYFFIYFLKKSEQINSLPNIIKLMLLDRPLPCHSTCIVG